MLKMCHPIIALGVVFGALPLFGLVVAGRAEGDEVARIVVRHAKVNMVRLQTRLWPTAMALDASKAIPSFDRLFERSAKSHAVRAVGDAAFPIPMSGRSSGDACQDGSSFCLWIRTPDFCVARVPTGDAKSPESVINHVPFASNLLGNFSTAPSFHQVQTLQCCGTNAELYLPVTDVLSPRGWKFSSSVCQANLESMRRRETSSELRQAHLQLRRGRVLPTSPVIRHG